MAAVLFVCLHNAGRSQMSAAILNQLSSGHSGMSAGTTPASHVHPVVVEAMSEVGIDLANARPQRLTTALAEQADVIVTMGCGDACPVIPGKRYVEWDLPDPKDMPLPEVRRLRDEIERRVSSLARDLG